MDQLLLLLTKLRPVLIASTISPNTTHAKVWIAYFVNSSTNDEVRILKRVQILVSDLWACFNGKQWGYFHDIDEITMFADYRVPQILHMLGCISYSESLTAHIKSLQYLPHDSESEIEIRGCSIWAVELMKKSIAKSHPGTEVNAILIDFYLWDSAKRIQAELGGNGHIIPCHRTRSIFY